MIKTNNNSFHIFWGNWDLEYDPITGRIQNRNTQETFCIKKNPSSQFPIIADLTVDGLIERFKPNCLTLYLSHTCNLKCDYCYIQDKETLPQQCINMGAVKEAAKLVATNCYQLHIPFILGFHGGNEPLLYPDLIDEAIKICKDIATQKNVEMFVYCTTNGVTSKKVATWAAQMFDGITLSWDGPAEIHDRHRITQNGLPTSLQVKKFAKIYSSLSKSPQQLRVRVTVTEESVDHLIRITQYLHAHKIRHIEFYPAFQDSKLSLKSSLFPNKIKFVKYFLKARNWARYNGIHIGYAGSRINDFHDKYCPVFQNNLTVTPDGFLTACFKASHNFGNQNSQFMYGHYENNYLNIDWSRLYHILQSVSSNSRTCQNCFNYLHCAKGCPNICPIQKNDDDKNIHECTVEKWIGLANLIESAGYTLSNEILDNCDTFFPSITVEPIQYERELRVQI